jgi:hypothetical protein
MSRRWSEVVFVVGFILALSVPVSAQTPNGEVPEDQVPPDTGTVPPGTDPGTDPGLPPQDPGMPQDPGTDPGQPPQDPGMPQEPGQPPEEEETLPTYEESWMELPTDEETPQQAFLRLAEFTIRRSEIGATTPGRIPIAPRGALKAGPVIVFPYMGASVGYKNNAFQTEPEDGTGFARGFAGFTASYPFLGGKASLDAGADVHYWEHFDNDVDDYWEWVTGVSATWTFYRGAWVTGGVKWEHLADPISAEFSGKAERDQIYPYVDFGFADAFGNKTKLEFGLEYQYSGYEDQEFETAERDEYSAWVKVSRPFVKDKSRVYLRYTYRWRKAESERINDLDGSHEVTGGIEGAIPFTRSERLTGFVEVGYRYDAYDTGTYQDGGDTIETDDDDSFGGLTGALALRYLAGPKTSLDLRGSRNFEFSTQGNNPIVSRVDFSATHNVTKLLVARLGLFWERNHRSGRETLLGDPDERQRVGNISQRYGAGVGGRYKLDEAVDLDGSVDYSVTNTRGGGPDFTEFIVQIGITLYFK